MTSSKLASCVVAGLAGVLLFSTMAFLLLPRLLNWDAVVILSGSMEPSLKAGGIAYVDSSVDGGALDVGDVVTFGREDGSVVTHRIVGRYVDSSGVRYQTMGDANSTPDRQLIEPADVQGKVVLFVPWLGGWSQWLQNHAHFQILIWPIAALIVINELWSIGRQVRRGDGAPGPSTHGGAQRSRRIEVVRSMARRAATSLRLRLLRLRLRLARLRRLSNASRRALS